MHEQVCQRDVAVFLDICEQPQGWVCENHGTTRVKEVKTQQKFDWNGTRPPLKKLMNWLARATMQTWSIGPCKKCMKSRFCMLVRFFPLKASLALRVLRIYDILRPCRGSLMTLQVSDLTWPKNGIGLTRSALNQRSGMPSISSLPGESNDMRHDLFKQLSSELSGTDLTLTWCQLVKLISSKF